jgi:hypothetical protein
VAEVWGVARPVNSDPEASRWLRERGLDVEAVARLDLARVLNQDAYGGMRYGKLWRPAWLLAPWTTTNRIAVPAYTAEGRLASFRFRATSTTAPHKVEAPRGFAVSGLVLACPIGRALLAGEPALDEWSGELVIAEGEPDWLTWATGLVARGGPRAAVLGVWSGAWTPEIAARIPDRTRVAIRTHLDDDGDRYAAIIADTLTRRCQVFRLRRPRG